MGSDAITNNRTWPVSNGFQIFTRVVWCDSQNAWLALNEIDWKRNLLKKICKIECQWQVLTLAIETFYGGIS